MSHSLHADETDPRFISKKAITECFRPDTITRYTECVCGCTPEETLLYGCIVDKKGALQALENYKQSRDPNCLARCVDEKVDIDAIARLIPWPSMKRPHLVSPTMVFMWGAVAVRASCDAVRTSFSKDLFACVNAFPFLGTHDAGHAHARARMPTTKSGKKYLRNGRPSTLNACLPAVKLTKETGDLEHLAEYAWIFVVLYPDYAGSILKLYPHPNENAFVAADYAHLALYASDPEMRGYFKDKVRGWLRSH